MNNFPTFLDIMKEQESFKIEENEWNFEGLIKAINAQIPYLIQKTF